MFGIKNPDLGGGFTPGLSLKSNFLGSSFFTLMSHTLTHTHYFSLNDHSN